MIYVIDLDDTICFPNHHKNDSIEKYAKALPNDIVINKINLLYDEGNEIIIHSARRMLTHKGNIKEIENDIGEITRKWLKNNNVSYSKLVFGKPYGDFYIDDKGMSINEFTS